MTAQMTIGPCIALEISSEMGENGTHTAFREFVGPNDPDIARQLRPGTLRATFGIDKVSYQHPTWL